MKTTLHSIAQNVLKLRVGCGESSAAVDMCYDADGTTMREMAVSLTRTSGAAIATGSAATGNAAFTVGGVTKGVEGLWSIGATPMLTRFDVMSDANGEISGTFAAADGNGGAFNGLTLVGDVHRLVGTRIIFR